MSEYCPDKWVILEIINGDERILKVLGGWNGGYLDGDSWRVNSGITSVEDMEDHYLFHGYSGSTYKCFKRCEGFSILTRDMYESWIVQKPEHVQINVIEAEEI